MKQFVEASTTAVIEQYRIDHCRSPYLKAAAHEPSLETMQGPTGFSGVHAVPKSGHCSGRIIPFSTLPQEHPAGISSPVAFKPKRTDAS
jgi:hypothetical protein